jgi:F-type H+-transporting ATPase subunit beta
MFMSQPMFVAQAFTNRAGRYVPIGETVRGFRAILDGQVDHFAERAFYMQGTLDDVIASSRQTTSG